MELVYLPELSSIFVVFDVLGYVCDCVVGSRLCYSGCTIHPGLLP